MPIPEGTDPNAPELIDETKEASSKLKEAIDRILQIEARRIESQGTNGETWQTISIHGLKNMILKRHPERERLADSDSEYMIIAQNDGYGNDLYDILKNGDVELYSTSGGKTEDRDATVPEINQLINVVNHAIKNSGNPEGITPENWAEMRTEWEWMENFSKEKALEVAENIVTSRYAKVATIGPFYDKANDLPDPNENDFGVYYKGTKPEESEEK